MQIRTLSIVFTSIAMAASVRAGIILSDNFDGYTNGPIVGNSDNTLWSQHSGIGGDNAATVDSGQLTLTSFRSQDIHASLSGTFGSNSATALYASFTVMFFASPSIAGSYFAHFSDGGSLNFRCRLWASTTNTVLGGTATPGNLFLGIGNSSQANATSGQWTNELSLYVPYTIVMRYNPSNVTSTLWINPTQESDQSVTASDVVTNVPPSIATSAFCFRQNSGIGFSYVDELKVATSFADLIGSNTAPVISAIPNQSTPQGTPIGPIPFLIGDTETSAFSLSVSNSSSNPTLVPNSNIVLGGSGTNRTVTITPAAGQQGTATIAIYVSDGAHITSTSFTLSVGFPSISSIVNQIIVSNTTTPAIQFTIGDTETLASGLSLTASSSNPTLVTNIVFGGGSSNRTVTLTPMPNQTGFSVIAIYVSDGTNTVSTSFVLTVRPLLGLIFADDFSYPDGLLVGAPGSPWQHSSGVASNFSVIFGAANISWFQTEDVNTGTGFTNGAPFGPGSGVVLYTSFTVSLNQLPSYFGDYFAHFKDTGIGFRAKVFATTFDATPGSFRVGIANRADSPSAVATNDMDLNTTNRIVTKYNVATGESWLWVNPASESSLSVAATDAPETNTISQYGLRQDDGIGAMTLDDLRIGTSFNDVLPLPVSIPLNVQLIGGKAVLTWSNPAFALQAAPLVTGVYTNVSGATSPFTNSIIGPRQFFRLIY